ncbi:EthD family reductase [Microbacterium aurum]
MHDVFVTYSVIPDREAFAAYYSNSHVPLVRALPELVEFTWGFVTDPAEGDPLFVARLSYASRDAADRSFGSDAGVASVGDVQNFATEGVAILHISREGDG